MLIPVGLTAYRREWLTKIPDAVGKRWLWVALLDFLLFVLMGRVGSAGSIDSFLGGLHWQALVYAFWEAIMCVERCVRACWSSSTNTLSARGGSGTFYRPMPTRPTFFTQSFW